MSLYNANRRLLLSVSVACGFGGMYLVFHAVTSPLLDVERTKQQFSTTVQTEAVSPEVRADVGRYFPNHPWVARSRKHFRDHGRYLFCENFDLSEDGHKIVVKPIAILWRADSDEVPITLVADSAELISSGKFSMNDSELGRVTGGQIYGNVHIRGERRLHIRGGVFNLEESTLRLWSSEQVDFTWDGHDGSAKSGVEISLSAASGGLDSLDGVSKVQLLGRVLCNFVVPEKRRADEALKLHVNAARGFVFDVPMNTGTFSGLSSTAGTRTTGRSTRQRRLVRQEEVWVHRVNADGSVDELICPELRLSFRNSTDPETGEPEKDSMRLEHVQAWGRNVEFHSGQQDVHIFANDFQYSVDQRQIDIRHTTNHVTDGQKFVGIRRGASQLVVPHVRVLHNASGDVQRLECNGAGIMKGTDARTGQTTSPASADAPAMEARWRSSLVFQVAPDGHTQYVTLSGNAIVAELTQKMKLSAERIAMRLFGQEQDSTSKAVTPGSPVVTPTIGFLDSLKPQLLTATGNVQVQSPEGGGQVRQTLTVRFEESAAEPAVRPVSATRAVGDGSASKPRAAETGEELSFLADTADAVVSLQSDSSPNSERVPPYNIWLKGAVEVLRKSADGQNDFKATGNQLQISTTSETDRSIQLFGDPARVISETRNLEGPRIDLNELDGKAEVVGSGRIRIVTTKGFDGKDLPEPTPLDIYWSDHMKFRKRSAEFVGKTRVVMSDGKTQDLELLCSGLTIHFSKDVSLNSEQEDGFQAVVISADEQDASGDGPIERLECHHRVEVRIDQYAAGSVTGRHRAIFADLKINLHSGDFSAVGPGYLESVSPDKDGQLQGSSPVSVRPNTPSQTKDTVFVYLKTEFVGGVSGNVERQEATLSHNVVALMTPVRRVDQRINLQEIPAEDLPERAGILQADILTLGTIWASDERENSFSLVGRKNARLESSSISASADVITYDHSKEQFIIRAEGQNSVTVNHRSGPVGKFNKTTGTRFEYYRETNQLKADRIGGLSLTE